MQIGEPIRTVVVEPLELPVQEPKTEPEPANEPQPAEAPVAQRSFRTTHRASLDTASGTGMLRASSRSTANCGFHVSRSPQPVEPTEVVPFRVFQKPHSILPSCRTSVALVASTPRRQLTTCTSAATKSSESAAKSTCGARSWSTNADGVPSSPIPEPLLLRPTNSRSRFQRSTLDSRL